MKWRHERQMCWVDVLKLECLKKCSVVILECLLRLFTVWYVYVWYWCITSWLEWCMYETPFTIKKLTVANTWGRMVAATWVFDRDVVQITGGKKAWGSPFLEDLEVVTINNCALSNSNVCSIFFPSIGWLCGVGVFGLIECPHSFPAFSSSVIF